MRRTILQEFRPAIVSFALLTILTGIIYPLSVTAIAQVAWADRANGSLVHVDGKTVGSELIAQEFKSPRYFWSRPSGAGYNAAASSGSNLALSNPALTDAIRERAAALRDADPSALAAIPPDLVMASGSGLDPHISVASAQWQASRIARERGASEETVLQLIEDHREGQTLGLLGEERVNVLRLNLALDEAKRPANS